MRSILIVLAIAGIAVAALALREHYRTDTSPCSINAHWDCGIVNHSSYAVLWGVPVAAIGIAGYALLGALAIRRSFELLLGAALLGLGFSLYLAHIEANVLGVWCIYCVISLALMALITLMGAIAVSLHRARRSRAAIP